MDIEKTLFLSITDWHLPYFLMPVKYPHSEYIYGIYRGTYNKSCVVIMNIFRNVRGILEQLRAELKREENRRNELER